MQVCKGLELCQEDLPDNLHNVFLFLLAIVHYCLADMGATYSMFEPGLTMGITAEEYSTHLTMLLLFY